MRGFRNVFTVMAVTAILVIPLIALVQAQAMPGQTITVSPSPGAFKSGSGKTISYTLPDVINGNLVVMIKDPVGNTVWSAYLPDQHAGAGRDNIYVTDRGNNRVQIFYSGVVGSAGVTVDNTAPAVQFTDRIIPPGTISMDEMYHRTSPTPSATPVQNATPSPTGTAAPSSEPSATPTDTIVPTVSAVSAPEGNQTATPEDQAGGSGCLILLVIGLVAVIIIVAGVYFWWFPRK